METLQEVETVTKVVGETTLGKRRGRKRGRVTTKRKGWGLFNRETKYLILELYLRRTDAISKLEKEEQKSWQVLKRESPIVPVRVEISITEVGEEKVQF